MQNSPLDYFEDEDLNKKKSQKSKFWQKWIESANRFLFPPVYISIGLYYLGETGFFLVIALYLGAILFSATFIMLLISVLSAIAERMQLINYNMIDQPLDFKKWIEISAFIANVCFTFLVYVLISIESSPF